MAAIPTIDVSGLAEAEPSAVDRVAEELLRTFGDIGFAYVSGHGVDEQAIASAFAASRSFHDLPLAAKMAIEINEFHRGYIPINTSTVVTSSVGTVTRPNQSASLMVMHEVTDATMPGGMDGPNQWPSQLPGMKEPIDAYGAAMECLAQSFLPAIERALGAASGQLSEHFGCPTTFLRLLHYPLLREPSPDDFGSAPHSDYGFITLLAQDEVGGLEVRTPAGEWLPVPPRPGTFVLNVADMLRRWSNGRWISTPHRVQPSITDERYSLPFFFDPHVDTLIEPLPSCVPANELPAFEPVIYGDYLQERLTRNHSQHAERGGPAITG